MGIMVDKVSRHLPPPCRAVVVSGTYACDPSLEAEDVSYHRILDRKDRFLYANLGRLQNLIPGLGWDYHFRPYFHRSYVQRSAAYLAGQEVSSIVFPLYPQWAPQLKALNPKARLVLWMQCEWLSGGPAYYGKCLEHIDAIVCCSQFIADRIAARFPKVKDRVHAVPNGVDVRLFSPSENRNRHQIIYAGRLTPEKGAHVLLDAFKQIRVRYPDAQLILAGPFWMTPASQLVGSPKEKIRQWKRIGRRYEIHLRRKARRLKSVFLTDHIPHKALVKLYRTSSLFVHPSLWNEPFGMILAEAMACGLPVIASRCGGIPEVVQDGRSGILVEPNRVDQLVGAVERVFENRDLAARLGQAARARAEESFDWRNVASRMAEIALEV
jgi:glycosyltransferase involved in cell wall biosynthesis